jgi:REP element-mobilizing transposase RayT
MPQSLSRILIHLVFSTKNREPVITPVIRTELHPYLAVTLDNIDCPSLRVGGVADHVHLFFGLSRTRTIAEVVETVKTSSSKWINIDLQRTSCVLPRAMLSWNQTECSVSPPEKSS